MYTYQWQLWKRKKYSYIHNCPGHSTVTLVCLENVSKYFLGCQSVSYSKATGLWLFSKAKLQFWGKKESIVLWHDTGRGDPFLLLHEIVSESIPKPFEKVNGCTHPDAIWLTAALSSIIGTSFSKADFSPKTELSKALQELPRNSMFQDSAANWSV